MREARGELPVGRKIGFTNRTAWTYPPMFKYNYEFYLLKHISHFIQPGAKTVGYVHVKRL
jgi:hypothetical protein